MPLNVCVEPSYNDLVKLINDVVILIDYLVIVTSVSSHCSLNDRGLVLGIKRVDLV